MEYGGSEQRRVTLQRQLGLGAVFAIAAGAMISSGLFVLPGIVFAISGPSMILAYALAGLLNVPTMLAQAELATAMPKAAGSYFVVERSLGTYWGLLAGLFNWSSLALKAAFALIGIGVLAELVVSGMLPAPLKTVAVLAAVFFVIINFRSVKSASWLQGWMVAGLLGALIFYVVGAFPHVEPSHYRPFFKGTLREFMMVTGMVFVSYGGLTKVVDVAEEVRKPHRNLPWGMFLSYATVNLLYVLVAFVTVGVLQPDRLAGSLRPVTDGALATTGYWGEWIIGIAAFLAYATTGNAGIMSAARTPMAMSHDGLLPTVFGRVHARFRTPHTALLLTGAFVVFVIVFLSVEDLVKTASTMLILSLGLINVAVMVMRRSGIEGYRPTFRMPLVPWLPLATLVFYGFLIAEMGLIALTWTFGFIAVASIWYFVYVQRRIRRQSAAAYLVQSALSRDIPRSQIEDELVQISLERDEIVTDRFDDLVKRAPVLDIAEEISGRDLFRRLGECLGTLLGMPPQRVEEMLLQREREASTVVQTGIAIPHVVVGGKGVFQMVIVRCRKGAVFSELQEPVRVVFALAGSSDERNFHLRALMAIATIVQEENFLERWLRAANEGQLKDILLLSRRKRMI
jgi:APA family basic amino acid/polyamine antiporter